eukprot:3000584-Pyramimonas_sp.AAC.1
MCVPRAPRKPQEARPGCGKIFQEAPGGVVWDRGCEDVHGGLRRLDQEAARGVRRPKESTSGLEVARMSME